jgi:two-component SAPR family response regulator
LLVFGGRGVRDTQIIEALWPDAEGDAGRRVFDTTLHRLRRQLGDADLLRMNDGRLYLDERSCWLDTWAFDDLAAEAERQIASEGPASSLVDLAQRIGKIYRGPVLADVVAGSPWAARSRERYARKFLQVAQSLGRALENAGKASDSAALYSRANDHRIAGQRKGEKSLASE